MVQYPSAKNVSQNVATVCIFVITTIFSRTRSLFWKFPSHTYVKTDFVQSAQVLNSNCLFMRTPSLYKHGHDEWVTTGRQKDTVALPHSIRASEDSKIRLKKGMGSNAIVHAHAVLQDVDLKFIEERVQ